MRQLLGPLWRVGRLSSRRRSQLAAATAALAVAKIAVQVLPFRRAIILGSGSVSTTRHCDESAIGEWAGAVRRASRAMPWRSVCIHEALALQWLLRRRGVPALLRYGTAMNNGKLESHAWIDVGEHTVLGGEGASRFKLLATYPRI